jgi:hypothetical protein
MKRLASSIPPDREIDERLAQIDAQMFDLGQERNALALAKQTRDLALRTLGETPQPPNEVKPEDVVVPGATVTTGTYTNGTKPSNRDALRQLFLDAPDGVLNMNEIMAALAVRGWTPDAEDPRKLIGAAISGLVHKSGELEPTSDRGTYRAVNVKPPSIPIEPLTLDGISGS